MSQDPAGFDRVLVRLRVNGEDVEVAFDPSKTLLEVLREDLNLTGTKHGCELGECGACAVLVDGEPMLSCLMVGLACAGTSIQTVEGLADGARLHPLQAAFADCGASQCGYCTPGMLLTAKCLLERNPDPTRDQIREALSGNICRCTGYQQILDAVQAAAAVMRDGDGSAKTSEAIAAGLVGNDLGGREQNPPPAAAPRGTR
jgi:carbon-monoxide dehydrogenase small subunit